MILLLLLLSLALLFYSLLVGDFPDEPGIKKIISRYLLPAASAGLTFLICSNLFMSPITGLLWAILGWVFPRWVMDYRQNKRRAYLKGLTRDFVVSAAGLYSVGKVTADVVRIMADRFPKPLSDDFQGMIGVWNSSPSASFPRMFEQIAKKYNLPEFHAVATILSASERTGGPLAAARGLKKLGEALRSQDRMLRERNKAMMEPKAAAYLVIGILTVGLVADVTVFRDYYSGSGKIVLSAASALYIGLIFMVNNLTQQKDLA